MAKRRDALNHTRRASGGARRDAAELPVAGRRLPVLAWWYPVVLAALVVLAYANGLSGPFVFDDKLTVVENRQIRDLTAIRSLLLPERELPVAGRPVANISFAVNYALHGLEIRGYRVVNVTLHLLCGLLMLGVVRRTLSTGTVGDWATARAPAIAVGAAALWLVHPLNSEAVSYLTQRTEQLMALCYLATLYAAIRAVGTANGCPWTAAAVVACAAGMGSKESMVTAPIVVMLYDRVFLFSSVREAVRARWRLYLGLVATWGVLAVLQSTGPRIHSAGLSSGVSPWTYLLNQAPLIVRYLRLSLWPDALVLNYGVPQDMTIGQVLPQFIGVAGLSVIALAALARAPIFGFLGAWFFMTLAPTSSVLPIATEVGAERRMYVPLMALAVLAAVAGMRLADKAVGRNGADAEDHDGKPVPGVAAAVLILVVGAYVAATMHRNEEYGSALVLAQTSYARWPTPVSHHMVATELSLEGREDEALAELRESVKGYPRGNYDLGIALFRKGAFADAVRAFDAFVAGFPNLLEVVEARVLAGRSYAELQRWPEAIVAYEDALRMRPSRADAHGLLADVLVKAGRSAEAAPHYRRFLAAYPTDVGALGSLGVLLVEGGQLPEAVEVFRRAVEVDPRNAAVRRSLAGSLLARRDIPGALEHARQAAALAPDDPLALDLLGVVLMNDGHTAEAVSAFERAARLAPGDGEVRSHLEAARTLASPGPAAGGP